MSTSDREASIETGSSCGEGAPVHKSEQGPETAVISQQTAVSTMEDGASTNGDPDDEQVDLKANHEKLLTNIKTFFPELVWRQVVGKLGEKADIENCSSSSPFFADLVREKRERGVVLPTVFGILSQRYCDWGNKDEAYQERNVESIPWKRPALSGKEAHRMAGLWKCRLVCKKWNEAIEELHRNEDADHYGMLSDLKEAENEQLGREWATDSFRTESKVVKFLDHFEATHYSCGGGGRVSKKCPFLGRAVEIRVGWGLGVEENGPAYLDKLLEMLEKFGAQVFYFQFDWLRVTSVEYNHVDIYLKLKEMVELMRNLKVLRIWYANFPKMSKQELVALEKEILRNPFPKMANLEMISAEGIPGLLSNHLVNQNRQLKRLQIMEIDFNGNCSLFTDKLPNLRQLALLMMDSMGSFEAFEHYPATLSLEKFHLTFTECCPFAKWSRLFNLIDSKLNCDCCTELVLQMPRVISDAQRLSVLQDSLLWRLKLANIEYCEVTSFDNFSLDFLLESKNTLREMRIELHCDPSFESGELEEFKDKQVIKFLGCEDKMEKSNIGIELPRLRKLEVINHVTSISRHYTIEPSGVVKFEKEELGNRNKL